MASSPGRRRLAHPPSRSWSRRKIAHLRPPCTGPRDLYLVVSDSFRFIALGLPARRQGIRSSTTAVRAGGDQCMLVRILLVSGFFGGNASYRSRGMALSCAAGRHAGRVLRGLGCGRGLSLTLPQPERLTHPPPPPSGPLPPLEQPPWGGCGFGCSSSVTDESLHMVAGCICEESEIIYRHFWPVAFSFRDPGYEHGELEHIGRSPENDRIVFAKVLIT